MNTETNESVLASAVNTPASGHSHSDDCYAGHKHTAVFGTTDLTKTAVYLRREYGTVDLSAINGAYGSGYTFTLRCAVCNEIIYKFCYIYVGGGGAGYMQYYASNGASNTVYYKYANSTVTSWSSAFHDLISSHGGTSANNYTTSEFYFPYTYLMAATESGEGYTVPYSGCINVQGHPDPNGCFAIGKKSQGFIVVGTQNINNDWEDGGYCSLKVNVFCDQCGRYILGYSVYKDQGISTNIRSGVETDFFDYTSEGSIIQRKYSGFLAWNSMGYAATVNVDNWNDRSESIYNKVLDMLNSLPRQTYNETENWFYLKSQVVTKPFDTFPVVPRVGDMAPEWWQPFRGCVYCGSYGTAYSCGKESTINCNLKISRITPTHPVQSVYTGEALITTVKATYQDGSTKIVLAGTDFHTDTPVKNKSIVLSYTDTLGNVKTCSITVNVIPRTKTCINGHTYNLNNNGSDPGCPFCRAYVKNIRVISPSTSTMTITIGTTLQENGVKLLVTYYDGHTETITGGYEDNLDKQYLGTKPVTIGYKGVMTQLMVTTVCAKMVCERCGFIFELYPDGINPGCPRCISKTPVFTGKVLEYDEVNYTNEILEELYGKGEYSFHTNDTLSISIKSKTSTIARSLLQLIFLNMEDDKWLSLKKSETIKAN
jgi:hypothetical protein